VFKKQNNLHLPFDFPHVLLNLIRFELILILIKNSFISHRNC